MKKLLLIGALLAGILSFNQVGEKVAVYVAPGPLVIEDQKV